MSISILVAQIALADLSTICVTIASRFGGLAAPSADRHDDRLIERIGRQRRQTRGAAAAGVAGLPLLEAVCSGSRSGPTL
jgi:hypothetical protein